MRLTEKDAAEYLGMNRRTVAGWRRDKKFRVPFRLVGHRAYYEKEDLDRYLEGTLIKPKESPKSNNGYE